MSVSFLTKRKIKAALALAVDDRKVPDDATHSFYRYGTGSNAEYGVIWPNRAYSAPLHVRSDGSIFLGHAQEYAKGSFFERQISEWSPLK